MKKKDSFDKRVDDLAERIGVGTSFDVVRRDIEIGDKKSTFFYIDGFIKDDIMLWVMSILQSTDREEIVPNTVTKLVETKIPYVECDTVEEIEKVEFFILSGSAALFIEGIDTIIIIDARTYPARSPGEPDLEKVTRGSRDGFVETIVFNTALIRRRVRDPGLRFELTNVGKRSQSDVAIAYIKDITNTDLINSMREKIKKVEKDALTMGVKSLEEFILGNNWNPFPQAKFTERPDVAAAHLFEGHILVMVDTTPSVMILPATMFHFTQHAEDYYQNPAIGTYMRWIRFFAIFVSYILPPLWLLFATNTHLLPKWLEFIGPKETGQIPLVIQFLILEVGIDILRMASIHTPSALTTSLGIIGGLLLSEFAIKVGWFISETVLYTGIMGLGMFATPSLEFALAIRIYRMILLILTGLFGPYGFIAGILLLIITLLRTKSFGGINYLWPLIPFNKKALMTILMRKPIPEVRLRPDILRVKDLDSSPPDENTEK
ncbi:spore germination protein [Sporosalibacterium faouarense]|uniref:spore germination protein n=1 Tax=Sporosalibacterium faouarense TaxID=516123 RepID=UPI00141D24FB|nr:spore germination protein [Sporosalibacterium faouarense]MTI49176.1 spore germination protein [Bacillota bacterium]